jgi:hypothetical protein
MSIPVWVLLAFALWTLLILFVAVGVYRWVLILTGRVPIGEWKADGSQGADWYRRAMRAHANCLENLPVYGALVLVMVAAGITDPRLDALALVLMGARVVHTLVHVTLTQTNRVAAIRFSFFMVQFVCMVAMAGVIAALA